MSTAARSAPTPGHRTSLAYLSGFGNHVETEALAGALPTGRNSPQRCTYGLYAEQYSGTAFTALRANNRRSWLYRIRPAAVHRPFQPLAGQRATDDFDAMPATPNQLRWNPLPIPDAPVDFMDGLVAFAGNGDPYLQQGCCIYLYAATRSMTDRAFCSADGDLLILPQQGRLRLTTELGLLDVEPQEMAVIPRGLRFRVELADPAARGYVCESFGASFRLPELGPIGANGLAQTRDFQVPVAWYEDRDAPFELVQKFMGRLWWTKLGHSPFDVVAWHGNLAPYKYDLRRFNTLGSISHDHPDPSIFTVLQSPSDTPGVNMVDFVIFVPRILAMKDTFRPPWFHRNVASEFMGLIHGRYDAKAHSFVPGGASLHNCMAGHGPDAETFEQATSADLSQPTYIHDTMAFMFETRWVIRPTRFALESAQLQSDYHQCWTSLQKRFNSVHSA